MLKLNKPLCFFDLETTGTQISSDRIVEIAILKVLPNGKEISKCWRVNPEISIPIQSSQIHGITNEMVANESNFKTLAPQIIEMIKDSDLAGYNSNKFDIPLLAEELLRNGFDFDIDKHRTIDVQVIFYKMEPRTLTAAYSYYCNKNLNNAHSAEADTRATFEVLQSQLKKYEEVQNDVLFLEEFTTQKKSVDLAGFIIYNDKKEEIFSFGKYKGIKVSEVFIKDPGYYSWIQNADFPFYTKKVLTKLKLKNIF